MCGNEMILSRAKEFSPNLLVKSSFDLAIERNKIQQKPQPMQSLVDSHQTPETADCCLRMPGLLPVFSSNESSQS